MNRTDLEHAVEGVGNHDDAASLHLELAHQEHGTTNGQHRKDMRDLQGRLEARFPGSARTAATSTYEDLRGEGATGVGSQRRAHQALRTRLGISNDEAALERRRRREHDGTRMRRQPSSSHQLLDQPSPGSRGGGRRVPPRPAQTRRSAPSSLSLPSIPTGGLGDVSGGAGKVGWAIATAVVGLSLVYLLVNQKGNGPRGFSALLGGVTNAVSLLVEPVDPLAGPAALKARHQARRRTTTPLPRRTP